MGKTHIIAKFRRTDLVICSHIREAKTPSCSQINMIPFLSIVRSQCFLSKLTNMKVKVDDLIKTKQST